MKIRNKEVFSEEVNTFLEKYYSYILKQEEEYYRSLPESISLLDKKISMLEIKIDIADQLVEWFEKHEEGSLFDMFIGCYAPDLIEFSNNKKNELTNLYLEYQEKLKFYELYSNLLKNGILIKYSDDTCYEVEPYNNDLYAVIK